MSCKVIPVEIGKAEKVKFLGIQDGKMGIEATIPLTNPNNFAFTLTSIDLAVFQGATNWGSITQNQTLRIPAKSTMSHDFYFELIVPDMLSGGFAMLRLFSAKKLDLNVDGTIGIRAFFIHRKIEMNQKIQIDMSNKGLKPN